MNNNNNKTEKRVSIILPSYNEKDNIAEAITRLETAMRKDLHEIIVVDDNSPDMTWKIVQDLKHPKVKLIHRTDEKGLASALKRGVKEATGNIVVWMDCDLGLPPEDVPKLVVALDNADVAIGSRYAEGGKDNRAFVRRSLSMVLNVYASFILSSQIRDYTSGFIAVKKNVVDDIGINPQGFGEYFVEFAYKCVKKNYDVAEVGYEYNYRKNGVSQTDAVDTGLLKLGWDYGIKILKLRFAK
jgi:dolichol-phosphate mannosyltransferase